MRMLPLTYSAAKACSLSRPLASFMNSFADLYHTHISASGRESHSFGSAAKISVVNRWPLHLMSQQLFSAAMSRRALHVPAPSTCMPLSRAQTSCGRSGIASGVPHRIGTFLHYHRAACNKFTESVNLLKV